MIRLRVTGASIAAALVVSTSWGQAQAERARDMGIPLVYEPVPGVDQQTATETAAVAAPVGPIP